MLKKLKFTLLLLCLPFAAFAADFDFKAGNEYEVLTSQKSSEPQVTEFFSFYCPHCFKFEPIAKALASKLPADTEFVKNHVNFLGGLPKEVQSNLSYAYIIAKQQGKGEQVADQIFHSIHVQRAPLQNIKDVKALLATNGISNKAFDDAITSMPVISAEKAMQEKQTKFSQMGALTGVPTFIVNDKYKINLNTIKSQEQLDALVAFLLKQ